MFLCAMIVVGYVCAAANVQAGGSEAAAPACNDFEGLVQGLQDARLRLTSGVFRGRGQRMLPGGMVGDVSFYGAFDFVENRFRMDREVPIVFIDPAAGGERVKQIGYKLVRTADRTLYLDLGAGINTTDILSVAGPEFRPPNYGRPIDVRTFGLADWEAVDGASFDDTLAHLRKWKVVDVLSEAQGRCVVTFLPVDNVQVRTWINWESGYTVDRFEMRQRDAASGRWTDILLFGDVSWEQRNQAWVPTSIYLERNFSGRETYMASLDWERSTRLTGPAARGLSTGAGPARLLKRPFITPRGQQESRRGRHGHGPRNSKAADPARTDRFGWRRAAP